jgi:YHS domain-containing protein
LAKDLIGGMTVDEKEAEAKGLVTEYKGQKYYLCAHGCMRRFEKDPEKYISA